MARQSHDEKCRKYKQQIENLKLDLEELHEKYEKVLKEKANLKRKYEKKTCTSSFLSGD